jgi:hypothetical protein
VTIVVAGSVGERDGQRSGITVTAASTLLIGESVAIPGYLPPNPGSGALSLQR